MHIISHIYLEHSLGYERVEQNKDEGAHDEQRHLDDGVGYRGRGVDVAVVEMETDD